MNGQDKEPPNTSSFLFIVHLQQTNKQQNFVYMILVVNERAKSKFCTPFGGYDY
jgi:hypothetical protein